MNLRERAAKAVQGLLTPKSESLTGPRILCSIGDGELGTIEAQLGSAGSAAIAQDFGFLSIEGDLDRPQYLEISKAARGFAEAGIRRLGVLIDSTGGNTAGLTGAVRALLELRTALDGELYTFAARHAASAAGALLFTGGPGKVFADAGSQVGSLRTVMRLEDSSRLWVDGLLVDVHEIKPEGALKRIGAPGVPITPHQLDFAETQVSAATTEFIRLLAVARGTTVRDMERMAGEGGLYAAPIARQLGLIDTITDEVAFRALVAGDSSGAPEAPILETMPTSPSQELTMKDSTGAPEAPTLETTPVVESAAPRVPDVPASAKPPEGIAASPPSATPANAELAETVKTLAATVEQLGATMTAGFGAIAEQRQDSTLQGFQQRLKACVNDGRIPNATAESAMESVKATLSAGANPEALVATYEALPSVQAHGLDTDVTFTPPGGETQAAHIDLTYFSRPGPDGKPYLSAATRARAQEAVAAVFSAGEGQGMQALEALWAKRGPLTGGPNA
jgi:ClpP class serine protease